MAYATLEQLKGRLSIDSSDTSRDDYLVGLLDHVTEIIEQRTGRKFDGGAETVVDEFHEIGAKGRVFLDHVGVTSITSVKVKLSMRDTWTTLTDADYEWTPNGSIYLYSYYCFASVSYVTAGQPTPADITEAALLLASATVNSETGAVSSERTGDLSVSYRNPETAEAAKKAMTIIDSYRIIGV